jgi:4-amino-4-deoxy-L-arabinose transferase-like glycosyltransferase
MPKTPFWVFIVIAIIYFTSVRVDTMDIDASQYASMSREMLSSHNWLQLYDHGFNYLDKPPFLFWVSAASMKIFGINNFGYKLPSILFALWALFATYKLAKLLYNETTARMAALILATCQGMFLMTNDVRCDTILMSWVVTAIWLIKEWEVHKKLYHLLLGCAAIGFGMMTKGPIALMVPVFCFMSDWILKRKWKQLFQPAYLLGIVIIALVLVPMSIGLYQQFDMHPNALVNGQTHVSGLRFFYWSQSFGRITGESPWKNGADISFLLVNMLWSFLPWVFILVPAIVVNIINLFKQKFKLTEGSEWVTTGGFILAYLALGSSAYQLPHYIFVAFPLAAIITANSIASYLANKDSAAMYKVIAPFIYYISGLLLLVILVLVMFIFPTGLLAVIGWSCCAVLWVYLVFSKELKGKLFWLPVAAMIMANIFMTNVFYYELLKYQVGAQVGKYLYQEHIPASDFTHFKMHDPLNSLSFYAQEILVGGDSLYYVKTKKYVLTMDEGLAAIKNGGCHFDIVKQGELFKVSELTGQFLNPATRQNAVKNYYLLKME